MNQKKEIEYRIRDLIGMSSNLNVIMDELVHFCEDAEEITREILDAIGRTLIARGLPNVPNRYLYSVSRSNNSHPFMFTMTNKGLESLACFTLATDANICGIEKIVKVIDPAVRTNGKMRLEMAKTVLRSYCRNKMDETRAMELFSQLRHIVTSCFPAMVNAEDQFSYYVDQELNSLNTLSVRMWHHESTLTGHLSLPMWQTSDPNDRWVINPGHHTNPTNATINVGITVQMFGPDPTTRAGLARIQNTMLA